MAISFDEFVAQCKRYEEDLPIPLSAQALSIVRNSILVTLLATMAFAYFGSLSGLHGATGREGWPFMGLLIDATLFLNHIGLYMAALNGLFTLATASFLIGAIKLVPHLHWMAYIAVGLAMLDLAVLVVYIAVLILYLLVLAFVVAFAVGLMSASGGRR